MIYYREELVKRITFSFLLKVYSETSVCLYLIGNSDLRKKGKYQLVKLFPEEREKAGEW